MRDDELLVLDFLEAHAGAGYIPPQRDASFVATEAEGVGMIRFCDSDEPSAQVINCTYSDADGLPVLYDLHIRADGKAASLEYWRVDYTPVLKWPESARDLEFNPTLSRLPE